MTTSRIPGPESRMFLALCALLLPGCSQYIPIEEARGEIESQYVSLMEIEQFPVGEYNSLSVFHAEVFNLVEDRTIVPYRTLDSLFSSMEKEALVISRSRTGYSVGKENLFQQNGDKDIRKKTELYDEYKALLNEGKISINTSVQLEENFRKNSEEYRLTCNSYGVRRIRSVDFGDSLDIYVEQLGDSLEAMGSSLANLKRQLNARFADAGSGEYLEAYQPVSKAELMLKNFQQQMIQLENTQARFYSANPEDYFITGPGIPYRYDVSAAYDLVVALRVSMGEFRVLERNWYNSVY